MKTSTKFNYLFLLCLCIAMFVLMVGYLIDDLHILFSVLMEIQGRHYSDWLYTSLRLGLEIYLVLSLFSIIVRWDIELLKGDWDGLVDTSSRNTDKFTIFCAVVVTCIFLFILGA